MTVSIVTDSTSDLPQEVIKDLGINVVPLNVHFGLDTFKDGVDIQPDDFYQRLLQGDILPKTSAPSPGTFKEMYQKLAGKSDGIISIHVSSTLSGTYDAALQGRQEANEKCRIEVIDSGLVSIGMGLLVIMAARAGGAGASIDEVVKMIQESIDRVTLVAALDTLEYLQKGGRIGKAKAWVGSLLSIKPLLAIRRAEIVPVERARTRSKAIEKLYEILKDNLPAREVAVNYSTEPEEAEKMVKYIKGLFPGKQVYLSRFGPCLGTYVGPRCLAVGALK